jgi:hypothetical protein
VTNTGIVNGIAPGEADVTATHEGLTGRLRVTIATPPATVSSVTVTGTAPAINSTSQFTATATFSDGTQQNVTAQAQWASSATSILTVNNTGVVTGVSAGAAEVTATFQGVIGRLGVVIPVSFTVSGRVTDANGGAALAGATITMSNGRSATTAANGTYSISNLSAGSFNITASATNYDPVSRAVNVSANTPVDFALTRTLAVTFNVTNLPCIASGSDPVDCTFVAVGVGGQPPYTYTWTFTNPLNNQVVTATGASVSPIIGCGVSGTGVATFNLTVQVTVTAANGAKASFTGAQQIVREAGSCGV